MTAMYTNFLALLMTSTIASTSLLLPSGQNGGGELLKENKTIKLLPYTKKKKKM